MDETRFGWPRWRPDGVHADGRIRWQRTDPWETGFVDLTGDQALLGQVDGRTSAAVQAWLGARSAAFRAGIEVVVIDPHAGYAAAVRAAPTRPTPPPRRHAPVVAAGGPPSSHFAGLLGGRMEGEPVADRVSSHGARRPC